MSCKVEFDIMVIGAGVVGLSIAKALLEKDPSLRLIIADKENSVGMHASGRNSGVIHAGFYYSPDSLKAKFCVDGNQVLRQFCLQNNIPIRPIGKIVIAKNERELRQLEFLFERGLENEVKLELLPASELSKYEPLARTFESFIWSPNTAVSDPRRVLTALSNSVKDLGGQIVLGNEVSIDPGTHRVSIDDNLVHTRHVINTAGSQADRIAHSFGFGNNLSMIPFMGVYRAVDHSVLPLSTLVYPVPNPANPFLGVHLTLTADGRVKIGPTAIPLLNREQYGLTEGWNVKDMKSSLSGLLAMLRGDVHNLPKLAVTEFPKLFLERLVHDASLLVPAARDVKGWKKMSPGIRSQLVDLGTGKLVDDFVVEGDENSTHVLNAVSPGWTASIPFGRHVAERVLSQI